MPYTKQHNPWVQDVTVIDAADMDGIETGIATAQSTAEAAQTSAASAQTTANNALNRFADLSDVANPTTALTNLNGVNKFRAITAGTGLTGGGDLTADRTLSVVADAGLPSQSGNSGKFLTTNGSVSSWGTPAGGGGGISPRVPKVGSYMGPSRIIAGALGSQNYASGAVPMVEIQIGSTISIDQLGFRVTTAEAAKNAKVLLYSSDSDGYPVTLVKDSGALSVASTGDILTAAFTPVVLTPGVYWAAIRSNGGTTVRFLACTQAPTSVISTGTTNIWNAVNYLSVDVGTYASPTATLTSWSDSTTTGSNDIMPVIFMRRSA